MADFVQALDPSKLVLLETAISFLASPFSVPPYNLPIFLFGTYAQESAEGSQSLQIFTTLVGISFIFDIIWMARNQQIWFARLLTIAILLVKIPTFLAFGSALRQRGTQFRGFGDLGSGTVWSMPGGLSGNAGGGYQTIDDEESAPTPFKRPNTGPPPPPVDRSVPPGIPGTYQSS